MEITIPNAFFIPRNLVPTELAFYQTDSIYFTWTKVLTLKLKTEKYSLLIQTKIPASYQKGGGAADSIWKMLNFII